MEIIGAVDEGMEVCFASYALMVGAKGALFF